MILNILEPDPNRPYGICEGCGVELQAERDMRQHFKETSTDGPSHTVRIVNRDRAGRIASELNDIAEQALDTFIEGAWGLVEMYGATEDEVTEAIHSIQSDFYSAWQDRDV